MKTYTLRDIHSTHPKNIIVGDYSYGYENIKLFNSHDGDLSIGKFCSIAWGLNIFLGGMHRKNFVSTYAFGYMYPKIFSNYPEICVKQGKEFGTTRGNVIIGNDVWIGANVTILSGVKIGDGSILSANSTIFSNVKPYSIVGGNPAKFWMYRFKKEYVKKLKEIKWWNWGDFHINKALSYICSNNIDKLIEYYDSNINT